MKKEKNIRILIAPLDWGLGHSTRCIPLINEFIKHDCQIIIAGEGPSLNLLKQEFPEFIFEHLRGYRVKIPGKQQLLLYFLLNLPRLILRIYKEHLDLARIVNKHKPHIIISDNRYGLWNKRAHCIFLTHQLNIIPPPALRFSLPILRIATRFIIRKYNQCWIVDHENEPNLSGELSHGQKVPSNATFIGLLSRFQNLEREKINKSYDIMGIISGPEPQRSVFEHLLIQEFRKTKLNSLIVRGLPGNSEQIKSDGNITVKNHLPLNELFDTLKATEIVICRGGYSTLMDMAFTGNKVVCIPTPGQTEQEYLAMRCSRNKQVVTCSQAQFNLEKCLSSIPDITSLDNLAYSSYKEHIKSLIGQVTDKSHNE